MISIPSAVIADVKVNIITDPGFRQTGYTGAVAYAMAPVFGGAADLGDCSFLGCFAEYNLIFVGVCLFKNGVRRENSLQHFYWENDVNEFCSNWFYVIMMI